MAGFKLVSLNVLKRIEFLHHKECTMATELGCTAIGLERHICYIKVSLNCKWKNIFEAQTYVTTMNICSCHQGIFLK